MKTMWRSGITAAVLLAAAGCEQIQVEQMKLNRDILYQRSTSSALKAGVYDGEASVEDLQLHGDLGLGVFEGLDGEMTACNGAYYQITADGVAHPIGPNNQGMRLAFAAVTFFEADQTVAVHGLATYEQLRRHIDNFIENRNAFYAVRIDGLFRYVKVRTVSRQSRPYQPWEQVVAEQSVFEFHNVHGTIVGFRLPDYLAGVNEPGYHLHFLTADRRQGGHVLECALEGVNVELDYTDELELVLPENELFTEAALQGGTSGRLDPGQ